MKNLLGTLILLAATVGLTSCASRKIPANSVQASGEDFSMVVEWYGAQSKPPFEVALATKIRSKELKEWADAVPHWRSMTTISFKEAAALRHLWGQEDFRPRLLQAQPDFAIQQYVLTVRDGNQNMLYTLGWDQNTLVLVSKIRNSLSESTAAFLDPLIKALQRMEARSGASP